MLHKSRSVMARLSKRLWAVAFLIIAAFFLLGPTSDAGLGEMAPPMLMIATHYTETEGPWEAMREWVAAPDPEKSRLPAHAIERFGLMPPLVLSQEDAAAVVDYIRTEYEKQERDGQGCGMRHGDGPGESCQHGEGGQQGEGCQHGEGETCTMRQGSTNPPGECGQGQGGQKRQRQGQRHHR